MKGLIVEMFQDEAHFAAISTPGEKEANRKFRIDDVAVQYCQENGDILLETGLSRADTYEQTIISCETAYLLGHALIKLSGI